MKSLNIEHYSAEEFSLLNASEQSLVWAADKSAQKNLTAVVVEGPVFNADEFVAALNNSGLNSFVYSSNWSSAMDVVVAALRAGWVVKGASDLVIVEQCWDGERRTPVNGLVLVKA